MFGPGRKIGICLAATAMAQTSVQTTSYSPKNPSAQCRGENLSVSRLSDDAGAGNRGVYFAFTNNSVSPCTLKGYPRITLLDRRGRPLRGVRVILSEGTYFQSAESAQAVTLEPGKTAWFNIAYNVVQNTARKCPVSARIRIIAPGTRRVFTLPEEINPCQRRVTVTPVRNGLPE
jgi:hypothetical protein